MGQYNIAVEVDWQHGDWAYEWYESGMLAKVKRPDGKEVSFEYDALGRRTAKIFNGEITRFVWDGNVLLHEWKYSLVDRPKLILSEDGVVHKDNVEPVENLVTWVYESNKFTPSAKVFGGEVYSIVSDYLGTPVQTYDEKGEKTWERVLSIYGSLKTEKGIENFVPFRYQGQYWDEEVQLCYNRFRYYDPESGTYLSQDPIGLRGGLPNFYGYVVNTNLFVDVFGLVHGLGTEVIRNGTNIFSETYTSGGNIGGGRLNQQEALLTHTERKFLNDIDGMVKSGDHLKMTGDLNPCRPGCQPAIRDFVNSRNVTAEYHATSTGKTYTWEKIGDKFVLQTEIDVDGNKTKYKYDIETRTRVKYN